MPSTKPLDLSDQSHHAESVSAWKMLCVCVCGLCLGACLLVKHVYSTVYLRKQLQQVCKQTVKHLKTLGVKMLAKSQTLLSKHIQPQIVSIRMMQKNGHSDHCNHQSSFLAVATLTPSVQAAIPLAFPPHLDCKDFYSLTSKAGRSCSAALGALMYWDRVRTWYKLLHYHRL